MEQFITAQKALQLTNRNQLSGVHNNRQPLLNDLATIISDAIILNAKLGFQHVFISYEQKDILECLNLVEYNDFSSYDYGIGTSWRISC